MKIKHSFITPLIIFLLIITMLLYIVLNIGRFVLNKEFIENVSKNIDLKENIQNNPELNNYLEEKKIPKEVLNNIDKKETKKLMQKIIDGLYSNKSSIISYSDMSLIIKKSILIYEKENLEDIYSNIENDIDEFSIAFANSINNKDFLNSFRMAHSIVNGMAYYILLALLIMLISIIIILEKETSTLILGAILVLLSIAVYKIEDALLLKNEIEIVKLIGKDNFTKIVEYIKTIYLTPFAIGIILLIIAIAIIIKLGANKLKVIKYDSYYRR